MTERGGATAATTVHATCLVLGEDGLLLRGPSGSGKSSLCLRLLDEAVRDRRHARLVGDDRVRLQARNGRLIGRPHPALAGLIEIRGCGVRTVPHAPAAVIRLVVDLVEDHPRWPVSPSPTTELLGVRLPVLNLARTQPREYLIREASGALRRESVSSQTHSAAVVQHWPFCV